MTPETYALVAFGAVFLAAPVFNMGRSVGFLDGYERHKCPECGFYGGEHAYNCSRK